MFAAEKCILDFNWSSVEEKDDGRTSWFSAAETRSMLLASRKRVFLGRRGPSAKRPRSNYCAYHNFPILSITHPPPPSSSSSFSLAHYQGRPRAPHTHSFIDIIGEFFVARVIWRTRRSGIYRCVNRTKPRTGASYYASHRQSFLFSFHHNPFRFNGPSNGRPGHLSIPYHHWLINVSLSLFFS